MKAMVLQILTAVSTAGTSIVSQVYARLGAPAGASVSADIAAIKAETALIKGYTDTEIATLLTNDTTMLASDAAVTARLKSANQKVYPTLAAAIVVTGAAGAWTLGAAATLAAINTIATEFYVDGVLLEVTPATNDPWELVLYHGAGGTEFARVSGAGGAGLQVIISATKAIPANDAVTAKLATLAGGSKTANVRFFYHFAT